MIPALPFQFAPKSMLETVMDLALDALVNPESRRKYKTALTAFIKWKRDRPFDRATVHAWRSELISCGHSPAHINVQLSAVRKLAREAVLNGYLSDAVSASIERIENIPLRGTRSGNWLTIEQAQQLILAPDGKTFSGKRDRALLALLVGCALRRSEACNLRLESIQLREDRWAIIDLRGKRGRIRTVPVPQWVKSAIDDWVKAAGITEGRILRSINRYGNLAHESLSGTAVLDIVSAYGDQIGVDLKAHDLRRTCAKLCRKHGAELEQIQLLLGHQSVQTTERYLGTEQDLVNAPNDGLGLGWRQE